jgi:hypothetical protein
MRRSVVKVHLALCAASSRVGTKLGTVGLKNMAGTDGARTRDLMRNSLSATYFATEGDSPATALNHITTGGDFDGRSCVTTCNGCLT